MRKSLYDAGARKRTVSVTLNSDLHAKAKDAGISLSRVAEEAIAQAWARRLAE
jgi:post-segregation antitoxin (ccd killing protein)